jgi:hypothetical protein
MSIVSNTRFSVEDIAIGGELMTIMLIVLIMMSLLFVGSKYWNKYTLYTFDMCSDCLLLTFVSMLIIKIVFII